jgi:hypothetical protein
VRLGGIAIRMLPIGESRRQMSVPGTKRHEDGAKRFPLSGGLCCKTRMFFAVEGLSVSFCHNPLFRSGIEPLRHRHLTHDLRRTSVWRQWRWTAKELGEAAQVLRGGGEQYLVPGAA